MSAEALATISTIRALRAEGRPDEALQLAAAQAALLPYEAELQYEAACVHDASGREAEAVPYYQAALAGALPPAQRLGALVGLGSTYRTLGRFAEARQTLQQATEEFPDAAEAQAFLAMALHNGGSSQAAVQMLLRLLAATSSAPGIVAYRRAIEFYAQDVARTWPATARPAEPLPVPRILGHVLRPIALADAAAWAAYATLDEVKAFTSSTAATVADVEAVIARTLAGEPASPILFAVVPEGSAELVATVGFHTLSALNGTAEITYDVAPRLWGRGLGSAACAAAVAWGFGVKRWHRIQATTLPGHLRSQRVLLRCGFVLEGRLRNLRVVRGAPADYLLYATVPSTASP